MTVSPTDPRSLGFRMPAEWEPHQATWFSWPHNRDTWPSELESVERELARVVHGIAEGEDVYINVLDEAHADHVGRILGIEPARSSRIKFYHIPTDDAWARDHGPVFIVRGEEEDREVAATSWRFNSWGEKYPPWDRDDAAGILMAESLKSRVFAYDIVLEGGSIDVNGAGALLTTTSCLLNPNRNPELGRDDLEAVLRSSFGVEDVIWLGDGIAGDDTDGHIDDITRFVSADAVVTVVPENTDDIDFEPLRRNLHTLRETRLSDGRSLSIATLPAPHPVFIRGERMPASYANFYVANSAVVVPTYGDPADAMATGILSELFPDREIITLYSRDLIWGLGSIHCLTQQVPAGRLGSW